MARTFKVGDHVSWNSEASRVSRIIIAIHTSDFNYKAVSIMHRQTILNTKSKATGSIISRPIRATPFNMHPGKTGA